MNCLWAGGPGKLMPQLLHLLGQLPEARLVIRSLVPRTLLFG
jgi:hypothetical protein